MELNSRLECQVDLVILYELFCLGVFVILCIVLSTRCMYSAVQKHGSVLNLGMEDGPTN